MNIWVCVISEHHAWKRTKLALVQTGNEINAILENDHGGSLLLKIVRLIRVNNKFEQLFFCLLEMISKVQSTLCPASKRKEAFERFGEQAYNALV